MASNAIEPTITRVLRRHHAARVRARARRIFPDWPKAVYFADSIPTCSCPMCGNPRRWFGEVTRQERKADGRDRED